MTTTEPTTTPLTEVEPVIAKAIEGINHRTITYQELLSVVAHKVEPEKPPAKLPVAAEITAEQKKALGNIPKVFGQVVPGPRRILTEVELSQLMAETDSLDTVKAMAEKRKDAIRTTVFNHFDLRYEAYLRETCGDDEETYKTLLAATPRDKDGHYVVANEERPLGQSKLFRRAVRAGSVSINPVELQRLIDGPVGTEGHDDWLAMTEQVRVLREDLIMARLREKPALVSVLAKVTTEGNPVPVFTQPKA